MNSIIGGADVKKELDKAVKKIDEYIEDNQGFPEQIEKCDKLAKPIGRSWSNGAKLGLCSNLVTMKDR